MFVLSQKFKLTCDSSHVSSPEKAVLFHTPDRKRCKNVVKTFSKHGKDVFNTLSKLSKDVFKRL